MCGIALNYLLTNEKDITKNIIKKAATAVKAIEKLYMELFVILVSRFALIDPLISRKAISATVTTAKRTPPADVMRVYFSEVKSEIKSATTTDGVQKTVEYFNKLPISSVAFASFFGFANSYI